MTMLNRIVKDALVWDEVAKPGLRSNKNFTLA
jgi:hypothetical protein